MSGPGGPRSGKTLFRGLAHCDDEGGARHRGFASARARALTGRQLTASLHIHRRDQLEARAIDIEIDQGGN
jgi:hypothetical protein